MTKKDLTKKEYLFIHHQLRKLYGKADHCENLNCEKKSTYYEWALKKDHHYTLNRDDYFQLCHKCHKKYDVTDEMRKNNSKGHKGQIPWIKGRHHTEETKEKLRALTPYWKGKKRSEETKRKQAETMRGRITWNKGKKLK